MQEFFYSSNIHVNHKSESVLTDILYYKQNKYYPHLIVNETSPQSASKFLRAEAKWVPN